ncbi:IclR family transcriptional regulator [Gordonia sp. OPL2]|uniref:IclR family transcriptional regulator n=1 Tax=Gordonia sp. OPL2 TaxID=2486274 RepID=UPI001655F2EA|nr:IclR family transcriptional regulator [Gordonia sp. OPL2]ROZ89174.1 IclR family transcriptional regulator [Gordonia sp. OPL2]
MARSPSGESVLERAVRILRLFTAGSPALTVAEIARGADLPIATAHRLVGELIELGVLERAADRRVRMGVQMWEWASRSSRALDLREAAMPAMEDLHAVVRHHTQLGVLEGTDVLYIERLSARTAVHNDTRIAGRLPIHATSAGLVLLANAAVDVQESVLAGHLARYTPYTITDPRDLRRLLADIRRQGYVVAEQMITLGSTGVGVPVRGSTGDVVAALCLVVPAVSENRRQYIGALMTTARTISRTLGAHS